MGALALAAVNITVPFITALVAISILFAMGGSTVIAIRLGRGDKKGANDAFMTALVLTLLLSILLLIIGMTFSEQIFHWNPFSLIRLLGDRLWRSSVSFST